MVYKKIKTDMRPEAIKKRLKLVSELNKLYLKIKTAKKVVRDTKDSPRKLLVNYPKKK